MKIMTLLICVMLLSRSGHGQLSQALVDFYQLEQQNWTEYILASRNLPAFSNFDVKFYHLHIDLSLNSPYLLGNVLCRFTATEDNTDSIKLNLRREYAIDSIQGMVSSYSFVNDTLTIVLDRLLQTGDSGWVQVYYHGAPPVANNTKGLRYVTHGGNQRVIASLSTPFLSHYWWPCKDGPGDKPDSVYVDISIPDTTVAGIPVVAISNGVLENIVSVGGKKTFQWREHYPIVPYYVMVAVSNYRDFHQIFPGSGGEVFPMDYYVFNENFSEAQQGVVDLPQVMGFFSDRFGVYPFSAEKYGMTQIGFYGAIENQTNTIINNMGIPYFGVAVHELAHMWFGDMITCKDWHHGWLNEGFATYAEALWVEHITGFDGYKNYMQNFQFYNGGTLYLQNISDPFNIFVPIIYNKGAYVLHMLRGVLGDSIFFDSMSAYAADPNYRYGHASTEDFKLVCESVSQRDLTFFFSEWVYDQYYPQYNFSYSQNTATGETHVDIRQTQSSLGRRPFFEMPIELKFQFQGGGDTVVIVWNNQEVQSFALTIPRVISAMEFDPDGWILKTAQPVSVDGTPTDQVPNRLVLSANYPNPFNPSTTISFSLPKRTFVMLNVYDLLGREVASLVNDDLDAGNHQRVLDATSLPSGVYFYRLHAVGLTQTRKMSVIK